MKFKITENDIAYAEKVLLKDGKTFDEERIGFIRCLETLDLQAVPGSGKTTALLAKLLILERYLPLENDAGILVLSHTNAAVDEIKEKIGKYCSRLFSYPHFVGTIQQFVNRFLAIPCANSLFDSRIDTIDTEIYRQRLYSSFKAYYWDENFEKIGTYMWGRHINRARAESKKNGMGEKAICYALIEDEVKGLYLDLFDQVIKTADGKTLLKDADNKKYQGFFCILFGLLKEGVISFRYAYHLAEYYLHNKPENIRFIRGRFPIVFVDEMQDMAPHQHDLLEMLFYRTDDSHSVFQRIGDKNQAIYSYEIFTDAVWTERPRQLTLKGSYRLSAPVAEVVKNFAESYQDIDARGSASHLPVIVVYDNDSIKRVVPQFAHRIKQLQLDQIPDASFHVVGWVREHDNKIGIKNYWEPFVPQKDIHKKEHYDGLADYVEAARLNCAQKNFKPLDLLFVEAILNVLRLEDIQNPDNQRYFTRTTLFAYLRDSHPLTYSDLRLNLYQWCQLVISGKDTVPDFKKFLDILLGLFGKTSGNSAEFITPATPLL